MNFCKWRPFFLAGLMLCVYLARYYFALPGNGPNELASYVGKYIVVQGQIRDFVEDFGTTSRSYVDIDSLVVRGSAFAVSGRAILTVPDSVKIEYGDRVRISGVLDPQKRTRPDIAGIFDNPQIKILSTKNGNILWNAIFELKENLQDRIAHVFPHPVSAFAAGILLGTRSTIPKNITTDFKHAGLTHVLAISGFNIVILIQCFEYLFSSLPRKISIWATIIGIILFTILVGASASVVRASVMGSLAVVAKLFGRRVSGLRTLTMSGFLMAMADPFIVIWDIGFQLSYGATAGILIFAKKWQEKLEKMPNIAGARDAMVVTTAAQVFTLPLMVYYFQSFSVISFVANIFVLPFIPWLMLGGFLSLFMGNIVAAPTYIVFKFVLFLIHFFASVPFGFIDFGSA